MLNEPLSSARAVETLSGLLADGGMTVLLVEHDMEVVFGLANKITVLHPARSSPRIIISVPGRNGVGRTTTARAVMGLVPPTSGRVLLDGVEIAGWAPHRMARRGRLCARGQAHLPDLTVVEDIQVAERRPARAWPLARLFELFPALRVRAGNKGAQLSGGEQQMLAIARALVQRFQGNTPR
jgi:branched-chain amino acid transport system ATP-binding protein